MQRDTCLVVLICWDFDPQGCCGLGSLPLGAEALGGDRPIRFSSHLRSYYAGDLGDKDCLRAAVADATLLR
jgi:hypothetical protein